MSKHKIGIIGGGKAGMEMMKLFLENPEVEILFIVDVDCKAVGFKYARENGIRTFCDFEEPLRKYDVNFIIEATGSKKVLELIYEANINNIEIITNESALLIFKTLDVGRKKQNKEAFSEINNIKEDILKQTDEINKVVKEVEQISSNIELLSINAAIEAARAHEYGRGFSVVAQHIDATAKKSKGLMNHIKGVNNEIVKMSNKIETYLEKIKA